MTVPSSTSAQVEVLDENKASYAVKVPFWQGLDLKGQIARQSRWRPVEEGADAFATTVTVQKWKRTFKVVVFRKKVMHPKELPTQPLRSRRRHLRIQRRGRQPVPGRCNRPAPSDSNASTVPDAWSGPVDAPS